jgi:hypothetical protein
MQIAAGATPGYEALLSALGGAWDGVRTARPRPDTSSPNSEHYAYYFRKSAASVCSGWSAGARHFRDDEGAFLRAPAWTCLKVAGRDRELLLVTYHAIYGSAAERRREVALLDADLDNDGRADDVVRTVRASRPSSDVILVGDFNLTPRELNVAIPRYQDLTDGAGSTVNGEGDITDNLFDHLVVPSGEAVAREVGRAQVLDVRKRARRGFFRTVSDHLPIRFVLPTAAPKPPPPVEPGGEDEPCRDGQVRANRNSGIYHVPGGASYNQTHANVECFDTAKQAEAAGYRAALN